MSYRKDSRLHEIGIFLAFHEAEIKLKLREREIKDAMKVSGFVRGLGGEMNKILNPGKYGLVICPSCYSCGYIFNPNHQVCPRCGGHGHIRMEAERDTNIPQGLYREMM